MMKSTYPVRLVAATILSVFVLTSCGGGKKNTIHVDQRKAVEIQAAKDAQLLAEKNDTHQKTIDKLVNQARIENPETIALEQLLSLSQDPTLPQQSQGQAALQYAELLFEFEWADAYQVNKETIEQWPGHPYLPHMHLLLAKEWLLLENTDEAMVELTLALQQPHVDPYSLNEIIQLTQPLLETVSQQAKIEWMLAASVHDKENQDYWLKQAAKSTSLEYVLQLRHSERPLTIEQVNFYRYFARERLMIGDYHTVRLTAKILENDMPDSEVYNIVKAWADSEGDHITVGILLPLTGKYATYGQQALRGIRLAMSRPDFEGSIVLRVQDTAGDPEQTVNAYHQLLSQGSTWVIGPLLSSNTQALVPFLAENLPVISLSNKIDLAADSPSLFIHSLAKVTQADFMARYALKQGKENIIILHGHTNSEFEEAAAFAQTFIDAGGEILDIIEMERGVRDNRPDLKSMRFHTDDEELLADLDQDLFLFSAEPNMDIKMPMAFDSIYIAAKGKKVAVLAGQMAYSGIRNKQLYGSFRWEDGHLMDDSGRYLSGAEFAAPTTSVAQPVQAVLDVKSQYRLIWDGENITPLFALAYDTAMNIASLGSRLGIQGQDAIEALLNTDEFPAISGNYYFDEHGISQKTFAVQRIRRGRIE